MSMTSSNLVDSIQNPNGSVAVKLQPNNFSRDSSDKYVGRTARYTRTVGNVLQLVKDKVPQLDTGSVYSVCDALESVIRESLAAGYAVSCLNLGVFYIACRGTTDGSATLSDVTVRFAPSDRAREAVSGIEVAQDTYSGPAAVITEVQNVATGLCDGTLALGNSARVTGRRLKVGGEGSGVWFAPVADGEISESGGDWITVTANLAVNLPGTLLFALPSDLAAGTYRIVIKTRYGTANRERKELLTAVSGDIAVM